MKSASFSERVTKNCQGEHLPLEAASLNLPNKVCIIKFGNVKPSLLNEPKVQSSKSSAALGNPPNCNQSFSHFVPLVLDES